MRNSRAGMSSADDSRAILDRLYRTQAGPHHDRSVDRSRSPLTTPAQPVYRPRVPMPTFGMHTSVSSPRPAVPQVRLPDPTPSLREQLRQSSRPVEPAPLSPSLAWARGVLNGKTKFCVVLKQKKIFKIVRSTLNS